jgi:hypothetical protein
VTRHDGPSNQLSWITYPTAQNRTDGDVPGPETKPQQKRKKKSIKYKIETKAIKQIKQIKHYGTRPKQTSND